MYDFEREGADCEGVSGPSTLEKQDTVAGEVCSGGVEVVLVSMASRFRSIYSWLYNILFSADECLSEVSAAESWSWWTRCLG